MTRPLPQIPRETLERFWKGEADEEPIRPRGEPKPKPAPRRRLTPEELRRNNAAKCRRWYRQNRERVIADKMRKYHMRKGRAS